MYVGKDGKVWLPQVHQRIHETVKVDNKFWVGFVLFTLGTLLCPPLGEESSSSNFLVLRGPKEIHKNIKLGQGCLLFLQVFCLDSIVQDVTHLDSSRFFRFNIQNFIINYTFTLEIFDFFINS